MRFKFIGLLPVLILSCREIQPYDLPEQISGYQLNGYVTSADGIPLDSVVVILYYYSEFAQSVPIDTQEIMITDPTRTVFVSVYTPSYEYIRRLFFGQRPAGLLPRYLWDGRDDGGYEVPSGKYFIRYVYDTTIVKEVPWVTDGHPTAITDLYGKFTFKNDTLPVGQLFDIFDIDNSYVKTDRVLPEIFLELRKGNRFASYSVTLEINSITNRSFTL